MRAPAELTVYFLPRSGQGLRGMAAIKTSPNMPHPALTPEYMLQNLWIAGDPYHCGKQLRKPHENTGGFGTPSTLSHEWGDERARGLRSSKLLSESILPRLDDLSLE